MKPLPNEKTLLELLELTKSYEEQARKLYQTAEGFTQKWEQVLNQKKQEEKQTIDDVAGNISTGSELTQRPQL